LCSGPQFAQELLEEDSENEAVEWAQARSFSVKNKCVSCKIHKNGHVLSAVFVPIDCSLSVRISTRGGVKIYYFDPTIARNGFKFSLYLPLLCLWENLKIVIEVSPKYEGREIPITFFYLNLRSNEMDLGATSTKLYNAVASHLEKMLVVGKHGKREYPTKLSFVTKGRFQVKDYSSYITQDQFRKTALGNFELVTLYTLQKAELCRILGGRLAVFHVLE